MTNYAETLRNPHFNNIAAIIREPLRSPEWRQAHPEVPFFALHDTLVATFGVKKLNAEQVTSALSALLVALVEADERLSYTTDDLNWFVAVLDSPDAHVTLNMLQAWWSAPDEYVTPAEVAAATGTSESQWRNKAAAGEIPGTRKAGKQWLLPVSVLRSRGIEIAWPATRGVADE